MADFYKLDSRQYTEWTECYRYSLRATQCRKAITREVPCRV